MLRLVHCPKCSSVWELDSDATGPVICGACHTEFDVTEKNSLFVSEDTLKSLLEEKQKVEESKKEASLSQEKIIENKNIISGEEKIVEKESGSFSFLNLIWVLIILFIIFCLSHKAIIGFSPLFKPIYEKVCTAYTCPGFVWSSSKNAFNVTSKITKNSVNPTIEVTITNTTNHVVALPQLVIELLDNAQSVLMTRNLDPTDYGQEAKAALSANESVSFSLTVVENAPYPPASVSVRVLEAI